MNKTLTFKVILFLALLQGVVGLLRAYDWVQLGVDLFGQGLLLLPFVGAVAVIRGLFISAVASVIGALLAQRWAWWTCLSAMVLNLLLVLGGLAQGAPPGIEAIAWSTIPGILLFYPFCGTRPSALKSA